MEQVTDHAGAIERVLAELKKGSWIASVADLGGRLQGNMAEVLAPRVDRGSGRPWKSATTSRRRNPPYIRGIRLFAEKMPAVPLVGLFETAATTGAGGPRPLCRAESWHEAGVRRWGFHGASHEFIAERSAN